MLVPQLSLAASLVLLTTVIPIGLFVRALYIIYWHPLAKYPGPWYAASSSICVAIISLLKVEPQWMYSLVKKYGTNSPIRISPNLLMFPKPSSLREIYWDPKLNTKSGLYGTGVMGPPSLFTTLDGKTHTALRKALADPSFYIGGLKKNAEPRFDDLIRLFIEKMGVRADAKDVVCLSERVAEFAVDIMSMLSFTTPWGCVENERDEKRILESWRYGLNFFGFAGRFRFFRTHIMTIPWLSVWLLPQTTNESGMGWLMCQADDQVTRREKEIEEGKEMSNPDYLERCLNARIDGRPLSPVQKRAHVTLLIQAGADTTGTALGSTFRFLAMDRQKFQKAFEEIQGADKLGKLSWPIQYEETLAHLPYICACIREGLRLNPPASNLFARVVGKEGKVIEGNVLPAGTEITAYSYVVQRDKDLYAPDPDAFRPERWLESVEHANEMEAGNYGFGMGPRVCLGKDIALMELHKLIPETIRRFDIDLVKVGRYVIAGGVGYNRDFNVRLIRREK